MGKIEHCLRASMSFGVMDGNVEERGILECQIEEAIRELVRLRARAWHQAQGIERTLTTLRESTTKLETARTELLQHIEAQRKRRSELEARREIPSIERQIAQLEEAMEAPTGESIEDLDRQIAAVEEQAEAQRAGKQQAELEARIERLKAEVEAADTVAQACGPKGAPARLMAQVMGPFLQEANEALEAIFPGATVAVEAENETLRQRVAERMLAAAFRALMGARTRRVEHV